MEDSSSRGMQQNFALSSSYWGGECEENSEWIVIPVGIVVGGVKLDGTSLIPILIGSTRPHREGATALQDILVLQ